MSDSRGGCVSDNGGDYLSDRDSRCLMGEAAVLSDGPAGF